MMDGAAASPESLAAVPDPVGPQPIPVVSARRLLPVAFDLLTRSSLEMRRASFYIGSIVLGTVGPLALATWAAGVVAAVRPPSAADAALELSISRAVTLAGTLAGVGIVVAAVESRVMAMSLLGSAMAGRPLSPRRALARSRRVFWRAVVAAIVVAIPLGIVQAAADAVVTPLVGDAVEATVATTTLVTGLVGGPFAYVLAGVVLGDVDPFESVRRSFRVFRARKVAASLVVIFETVAILLIFLGAMTGLDLAIRTLDALGLGFDSGPAGLALMTGGIVAAVFAFGTLLYTVIAITVAPQVVMFVGLTQATMGLDHVRPGGRDDPAGSDRTGGRRFRTYTLAMLLGFALGAALLAGTVTALLA